MPKKNPVASRFAVAAVILLWAASVAVLPLTVRASTAQRGDFVALEVWVCSAALAATVTLATLYAVRRRGRDFDQGYMAAVFDCREPRVVSIASQRRATFSVNGDRRDSNKVS